MNKVVKKSALFGIVVLLLLLVVGSIGAQDGIPGEVEVEPEPGAGEAEAAPAETGPSAVRIDFELAPGHSAKRGHYSVQDLGGGEIASWYALDGWLDSGWINDIDIGEKSMHVQVLYYPGPDTEPTVMKILNPAPDTEYGWVSDGMAHALEVAWPDMPMEGEAEMVN